MHKMSNSFNPDEFTSKWNTIYPTVRSILNNKSVSWENWLQNFETITKICLLGDKIKGTTKLKNALGEEILDYVNKTKVSISNNNDKSLLNSYTSEWKKYFSQIDDLDKLFHNLNIALTVTSSEIIRPTLKEPKRIVMKFAQDIWRDNLQSEFNDNLLSKAMELINKQRNGEEINSQLVIDLRKSYTELYSDHDDQLVLYQTRFVQSYLKTTELYYNINATQYLQSNKVDEYMKYANRKLQEEIARGIKYLEKESYKFVTITCINSLISEFSETIISECPRMIQLNETEKLRLMFTLIDRTPDRIVLLLNTFKECIVNASLTELKAAINERPETYVDLLVNLLVDIVKRFSHLVSEAFNGDYRFETTKDKALKVVINDMTNFQLQIQTKFKSTEELLAFYYHFLLENRSSNNNKLSTNQIRSKLRDAVLITTYISNKDVFMHFYKLYLAKRLISETSDGEMEEKMVTWLKAFGMPYDYCKMLYAMLQDIKLSKDLNEKFKEKQRRESKSQLDLIDIKILNSNVWFRPRNEVSVLLPVELEDYIPQIEEFYKSKYSGRQLQWHHQMSNGIVSFVNETGKFDLEVSLFQMAVLFAWNERPKDRISFGNLKLATGLSVVKLKKVIWSLVANPDIKQQVLLFHPPGKSVKDFNGRTEFWINQEFAVFRDGKAMKHGKLKMIGKIQYN